MLILISALIISVTLWVCTRKLLRTLDVQGLQLQTEGQELRSQFAAINRVLLDGLKPDWWVKLTKMMEEFDEATELDSARHETWSAKPPSESELEAWSKEKHARGYTFLEELRKLPLHAVDPYVWAMAREAQYDLGRTYRIFGLLAKGSLSDDDRVSAKQLLRECHEAVDEIATKELPEHIMASENDYRASREAYFRTLQKSYSHSLRPRVGQIDLIWWFEKNAEAYSQERRILQGELEKLIEANTLPEN